MADHHQQPTAAVVIVFVLTEMIREVIDSFTEQGHLYFRRPCVAVVLTVLCDDLLCGFHRMPKRRIELSGWGEV